MITPAEIVAKAEHLYLPMVRAWLSNTAFWPQTVSVGKLPNEYVALEAGTQALLRAAKTERRPGYRVVTQDSHTKRFGVQSLPMQIVFDSERDLLAVIGKQAEFAAFQADVALIRSTCPALEQWLGNHPKQVIDHHGVWPELLRVCAYFVDHPQPGLYARELPIAVHTKFIERHTGILRRLLDALLPASALDPSQSQFERRYGLRYDEPLIRLRVLDQQLRHRLQLPISDFSTPVSQCASLPWAGLRCVITENLRTFLTLPALSASVAIFGSGFKLDLLARLPWLQHCTIIYWGDLDAHGFHILALLRAAFPTVRSVLMDRATLDRFADFIVAGPSVVPTQLPHLTEAEQALYAHVATNNLRLEQEHIAHAYACEQLALSQETV